MLSAICYAASFQGCVLNTLPEKAKLRGANLGEGQAEFSL